LEDTALCPDYPREAEQVEPYLTRHAADWKLLNDPPPRELSARVHRLWLLLFRAKLEIMAARQ
jgi:hypothetical protein